MTTRSKLYAVAISALFLAAANTSTAQPSGPMKAADIFTSVKPGQWVQMEGAIQKDYTVLCQEVKILTGDFQDDDWEIKAPVRKIVDPAKRQFEVLLLPVQMTEDADYENEAGTFKGFNDIKQGMLLEIEGTFLKDGTFLAEEAQEEVPEDAEATTSITAVGKVEKLDAEKRVVNLMGITFMITDKTKVKSAIK
jgi:hypothetical protein